MELRAIEFFFTYLTGIIIFVSGLASTVAGILIAINKTKPKTGVWVIGVSSVLSISAALADATEHT